MYKTPNERFVLPAPGYGNLSHIVIKYFNSHSTIWGYTTTDDNGEVVEQWADSCNLTLIQNVKLSKSFNSAKQYASDPFDNSTIETGDTLINNMKDEMGDHHNNQHDPQQHGRLLETFQRPHIIYTSKSR